MASGQRPVERVRARTTRWHSTSPEPPPTPKPKRWKKKKLPPPLRLTNVLKTRARTHDCCVIIIRQMVWTAQHRDLRTRIAALEYRLDHAPPDPRVCGVVHAQASARVIRVALLTLRRDVLSVPRPFCIRCAVAHHEICELLRRGFAVAHRASRLEMHTNCDLCAVWGSFIASGPRDSPILPPFARDILYPVCRGPAAATRPTATRATDTGTMDTEAMDTEAIITHPIAMYPMATDSRDTDLPVTQL